MPAHRSPVLRQFAEIMRPSADYIFAEQVCHVGHDAWVRQQIVDPAVEQVRRLDRITVLPGRQHFGEQFIYLDLGQPRKAKTSSIPLPKVAQPRPSRLTTTSDLPTCRCSIIPSHC